MNTDLDLKVLNSESWSYIFEAKLQIWLIQDKGPVLILMMLHLVLYSLATLTFFLSLAHTKLITILGPFHLFSLLPDLHISSFYISSRPEHKVHFVKELSINLSSSHHSQACTFQSLFLYHPVLWSLKPFSLTWNYLVHLFVSFCIDSLTSP